MNLTKKMKQIDNDPMDSANELCSIADILEIGRLERTHPDDAITSFFEEDDIETLNLKEEES